MLSRIAESLFWIGRYLERGDGTARILDVHVQLLLEDPWVDEAAACRAILGVMGTEPEPDQPAITRDHVISMLGTDPQNPASIAFSVAATRENARRAREIVSTEFWEAVNQSHARMSKRVTAQKAHDFFVWVRERTSLALGLFDSATSRDEAWQFVTLGRAIERSDMTARLLATRATAEMVGPSWTTILRSCGGYEAHYRSYRGLPSASSAAEFLLVDRLFPRSVISCLLQAESCLRALDPRPGHTATLTPSERILGQIRAELDFRLVTEILEDLNGYMEHVQERLSAASEAIRVQYFPTGVVPVWTGEVT